MYKEVWWYSSIKKGTWEVYLSAIGYIKLHLVSEALFWDYDQFFLLLWNFYISKLILILKVKHAVMLFCAEIIFKGNNSNYLRKFLVLNKTIQMISLGLNPFCYILPPRNQIVGNIWTTWFKLHRIVQHKNLIEKVLKTSCSPPIIVST